MVILCVDDEKITLDALGHQLLRYFHDLYEYEFAESGEEALKLISELEESGKEVTLVIADQIMPGMKGDELLMTLHQSHPHMIKIMLTGQASLESAINVINKANIYKYVSKPWNEQELMQIVEKGLERHQLETQKQRQLELFRYKAEEFGGSLFKQTSKEEFLKCLPQKRKILVYQQFPADHLSSVSAYQTLAASEKGDSCMLKIHHPADDYHYTFLGFHPNLTYEVRGQEAHVIQGSKTDQLSGDPMENLWQLSQRETCVGSDILPASLGGLIGFLAHDAVRLWEKLPATLPDPDHYPDLLFQAYQLMLCFDHKRSLLTLAMAVEPEEKSYAGAMEQISAYFLQLSQPSQLPATAHTAKKEKRDIEVDIDDATFRKMVEKAKEEIGNGNILKVILSRTFKRPFEASPLALFRATIMLNPSPYHYLLNYRDFAIVGASPEKLISSQDGNLESVPVAGTYARTGTSADALIEAQLLNDPKINIEHMMPVDVVRSDLAAVSYPGTVKVTRLKTLERFSHVVHVVSYLSGKLRKDLSPLDAVKAIFPAGTLCGVPRVRSLEMVEGIEFIRRGPYGGAVLAIDGRGNLDSGIIIRTAFLKNGIASVRTGAGIVYDSIPQKEADETRHKAKSMMNAMNMAEDYFS